METKYCIRCKRYLSLSWFNENKRKNDGLSCFCKQCDHNISNQSRNRPKCIKPMSYTEHIEADGMFYKVCSCCKRALALSAFGKNKNRKDGLASNCEECKKQHYEENRKSIKERQKKYREENREAISKRHKQYRKENPEVARKSQRQWQKNNPEKIKVYCQFRRSGDKNLTPEEKAIVALINRRCAMLNAKGSEKYEVDHIRAIHAVDENGNKLERGTSRPDNLQIVPMWYNRHKSNKCYGLYAIKYNRRTHGHLKDI